MVAFQNVGCFLRQVFVYRIMLQSAFSKLRCRLGNQAFAACFLLVVLKFSKERKKSLGSKQEKTKKQKTAEQSSIHADREL